MFGCGVWRESRHQQENANKRAASRRIVLWRRGSVVGALDRPSAVLRPSLSKTKAVDAGAPSCRTTRAAAPPVKVPAQRPRMPFCVPRPIVAVNYGTRGRGRAGHRRQPHRRRLFGVTALGGFGMSPRPRQRLRLPSAIFFAPTGWSAAVDLVLALALLVTSVGKIYVATGEEYFKSTQLLGAPLGWDRPLRSDLHMPRLGRPACAHVSSGAAPSSFDARPASWRCVGLLQRRHQVLDRPQRAACRGVDQHPRHLACRRPSHADAVVRVVDGLAAWRAAPAADRLLPHAAAIVLHRGVRLSPSGASRLSQGVDDGKRVRPGAGSAFFGPHLRPEEPPAGAMPRLLLYYAPFHAWAAYELLVPPVTPTRHLLPATRGLGDGRKGGRQAQATHIGASAFSWSGFQMLSPLPLPLVAYVLAAALAFFPAGFAMRCRTHVSPLSKVWWKAGEMIGIRGASARKLCRMAGQRAARMRTVWMRGRDGHTNGLDQRVAVRSRGGWFERERGLIRAEILPFDGAPLASGSTHGTQQRYTAVN